MTYCHQLLDSAYPTIDIHDQASHVLEVMNNHHVDMLPVLNGLQFLGMVAEENLVDVDGAAEMVTLQDQFSKSFVHSADHFLLALRFRAKHFSEAIPVLNERNEWKGMISMHKLLDQIGILTGVASPGSMIIMEVSRHDYALGEINRLVESNDAMIMQLNTIPDTHSEQMQIVLHINKEDLSDVVSTFQRHEYTVLYYYGEETYQNSLQSNLDHLLNYLNI
jgi:CBS-domain-containing membrane protein